MVERQLPKLNVASSTLVSRSIKNSTCKGALFYGEGRVSENLGAGRETEGTCMSTEKNEGTRGTRTMVRLPESRCVRRFGVSLKDLSIL